MIIVIYDNNISQLGLIISGLFSRHFLLYLIISVDMVIRIKYIFKVILKYNTIWQVYLILITIKIFIQSLFLKIFCDLFLKTNLLFTLIKQNNYSTNT